MREPTAETETNETTSEELIAGLEIGPPERVAVGRGTALALAGYCYHPRERTMGLAVELDGERTPVLHRGMPRRDLFDRASLQTENGGSAGAHPRAELAFRSGFVAMPKLAPRERAGEVRLRLVATLAGGREVAAAATSFHADPGLDPPREPAPAFGGPGGQRVAICMATYEPPRELLRRQLESLRAQTHQNWICLISDDASGPAASEALAEEVAGDPRFAVSRNPDRLGFYGNFERALSMTPPEADFVTLCDQDDRWHPEKLQRLLERMRDGVQLTYSDARVVDEEGTVIHPSYWTVRRNNYTNLGSLLIANTVTGAASLFRRELLDDVLPFPPRIANPYHDHWLSLVALARGDIDYVDQPLYDYVQHSDAVIGHSTANRKPVPARVRILERMRRPGTGSQLVYFYNWSQQRLFAEVLRMRCWASMSTDKRRKLRRFLSADESAGGLAWLIGRRARRLWGRNETLDIERYYAKSLLWRRVVSLGVLGHRRPVRWLRRDASIPGAPAREGWR